jgi:hypothetical protein
METVCCYETLISTYESTWRHNTEEKHRHLHRRENLRSHTQNVINSVISCVPNGPSQDVLCSMYSPPATRKPLLWCGAGGMCTIRWTRGLLLVGFMTRETCTTKHREQQAVKNSV